jgi:hypothetical protein
MHRRLQSIALLALPVLLLMTVVATLVEVGSAQNPNCQGINRCETFVSNGGGTQCANLYCSRSNDATSCYTQKCARTLPLVGRARSMRATLLAHLIT